MRMVMVKWNDAQSATGWATLEHAPRAVPVRTVGWLVKDTANEVVVAGSVVQYGDEPDEYGELIAIPRGMVEEIQDMVGAGIMEGLGNG